MQRASFPQRSFHFFIVYKTANVSRGRRVNGRWKMTEDMTRRKISDSDIDETTMTD